MYFLYFYFLLLLLFFIYSFFLFLFYFIFFWGGADLTCLCVVCGREMANWLNSKWKLFARTLAGEGVLSFA